MIKRTTINYLRDFAKNISYGVMFGETNLEFNMYVQFNKIQMLLQRKTFARELASY